jgi:hypothetical protein
LLLRLSDAPPRCALSCETLQNSEHSIVLSGCCSSAHDVIAKGFPQLTGDTLEQLYVFPGEKAAGFVLSMNDANHRVFPVETETITITVC